MEGISKELEKDLEIKTKKKVKKIGFGTFILVMILLTIINVSFIYRDEIVEYFKQVETHVDEEDEKVFTFANMENKNTLVPLNLTDKDRFGIIEISKRISGSIVSISTVATTTDWFNRSYETENQGSGIVFNITNEKIMIVTNYHVLERATKVSVKFANDAIAIASLAGQDQETDLAVISVDRADLSEESIKQLSVASFGDSEELEVGEMVIAIGNPMGAEFTNTVTMGIVSALNRKITMTNRTFNLIQTDAAINPGNSGGALVNYKGEVIGINSIKIIDTQIEGIGFAIPSNTIKPIVEELVNKGNISRPFIGIQGSNITDALSEIYEIPIGVYVRGVVKNGSAEMAGIKQGDVILEVNGTKIITMDQLVTVINGYKVGETVDVVILRNTSQKKTVKVKLQDKATAGLATE